MCIRDSPHHLRAVAVGLVVVEDLGHRNHTRIFRAGVGVAPGFSLVPIQDAPHEGGDQSDAGFGTGNGLTENQTGA